MNSRSERHKERNTVIVCQKKKKKKKKEKEDNEQDGSSLKYIHIICIVHYWIKLRSSAYVLFQL